MAGSSYDMPATTSNYPHATISPVWTDFVCDHHYITVERVMLIVSYTPAYLSLQARPGVTDLMQFQFRKATQ